MRYILLSLGLIALAWGCKAKSIQPSGSSGSKEEEVSFDASGRTVYGTISVPDGGGRHPAVLLIAGSGPTDRDWRSPLLQGKNGSARLLAAALTSRGLVVLRYDKGGTGRTAFVQSLSWGDYEAEQRAALAFLRGHATVDPARIFIAGHSEGGAHAVRLVSRLSPAERPAGLLLLASMARKMSDTVLTQLESQFRAAGVTGADLSATLRPISAALDDVIAGKPVDIRKASPIPGIQQLLAAFTAPRSIAFSREILGYDPAAVLRGLKLPVFIANGEKDLQVSVELDARRLEASAREGGNPDVTLHIAPNADHVFKEELRPRAELTPLLAQTAYNAAGRRLDPGFESAITAWLAKH
jgi:alpha-beta hydrolase superfamily lysophospholipase